MGCNFIAIVEEKVERNGSRREKDGVLINVYKMNSWYLLLTKVAISQLSFVGVQNVMVRYHPVFQLRIL